MLSKNEEEETDQQSSWRSGWRDAIVTSISECFHRRLVHLSPAAHRGEASSKTIVRRLGSIEVILPGKSVKHHFLSPVIRSMTRRQATSRALHLAKPTHPHESSFPFPHPALSHALRSHRSMSVHSPLLFSTVRPPQNDQVRSSPLSRVSHQSIA